MELRNISQAGNKDLYNSGGLSPGSYSICVPKPMAIINVFIIATVARMSS